MLKSQQKALRGSSFQYFPGGTPPEPPKMYLPIEICTPPGELDPPLHAMREIFIDDEYQGVLLVDANNAFNSLYRIRPKWDTVSQHLYGFLDKKWLGAICNIAIARP